MKSLFLIAVFCMGAAQAAQETTIEFKLTGDIHKGKSSKPLNVASLNKKLKSKKLKTFPEVVVWRKSRHGNWDKIVNHLKLVNKTLRKDIELILEHGYLYEFPAMCYRGNPKDVPEVVESLMGSVFHADQGIQGWRHGATKVIHDDAQFFENNPIRRKVLMTLHQREVRMWQNYSKKSDAVLLLSDFGAHGDGTELTATEIKRCH